MTAVRAGLMAGLIVSAGTTDAAGQILRMPGCQQAALGVAGGLAINNDRHGGESRDPDAPPGIALDLGGSFERPVHERWTARLDAGTVAWTFQTDAPGTPPFRDRVRLTRLTVAAIPISPKTCRWPVRAYAGGGLGIYRYRSDTGAVSSTRLGIHGVAGLDLAAGRRTAVTTEVGVHVVRGPDQPPVFSYLLWVLRAGVGVKVSF